jgi:hypothetical protein
LAISLCILSSSSSKARLAAARQLTPDSARLSPRARQSGTLRIGYPKFYTRSRNAVIRVYDEAGNVIEMHEQKGDFKE